MRQTIYFVFLLQLTIHVLANHVKMVERAHGRAQRQRPSSAHVLVTILVLLAQVYTVYTAIQTIKI